MSDIDTVLVDSLKALDPERPIREATIQDISPKGRDVPIATNTPQQTASLFDYLVGA